MLRSLNNDIFVSKEQYLHIHASIISVHVFSLQQQLALSCVLFTIVFCTEWDRYICRRCAGRVRRRLVVVICVLLTVVNSSFRLQANDCWQKGILLRRTVCVEQSS